MIESISLNATETPLTFERRITTAADNILKYFLLYFKENRA